MSNEQLMQMKTSSIMEILKNTETNKTIFNEYVEKETIGRYIFKELNKRFHKNGFVMQDSSKDVGILSQCQCMQTLVSLAQDFGLDFNTNDFFAGQKGTIREIMDMVIEDVIARICRKDENGNTTGFVFDASPYDTEHFSVEYSNIDTITWVITSFLLVLKYHAKVGEVCKWEAILIDIVKYGLDYINNAFIVGNKENKNLGTGWNFTKDCKEPSLYFSFAVCECYLDFYNTFEPFLEYLHAERNFHEYGEPVDDKLAKEFQKKEQEYEEGRDRKVGALEAKYDEYNELARVFRLISGIGDYEKLTIQGTPYETFEKNCKNLAQEVWSRVREDLAEKFFYNDLRNTVTEGELRMATTSDVLFNTVYIVNIMVGAGLDEQLDLERKAALRRGDLEGARKKEREYDNLLESCLLAVQKAFRTYESLKSNGKEYIVDQFLIGFNEDFDGHPIAVNELRKLRMRCFSLLPMLIHTNNVVSEYLVRYPQYNMRKYLEYILDNRLVSKDGAATWIWEFDGFFSGSNYYFVLALNEFYVYHEQYEKTYIEIGTQNQEREAEIRAKHLQQLQAPDQIIGEQTAKLAKKEDELRARKEEIQALKTELANIQRPVEDAVRQVVAEELEKNLATMLTQVFTHTAKVLTIPSVDSTKDTGKTYAKLHEALTEMLATAMLTDYAKVTGNKDADDYLELKKRMQSDLEKVSLGYIGSVENAADKKSVLRKMFEE